MPKRYIEDILPLRELNKYAQKGGGIGSLNAMHPYFARRPLTASRAMTLAALVDAPTTPQQRRKLEQLIVKLSSEEWPDMPELLQQARDLIYQAHDGNAPKILDPFAGGGSMPLEAMRLGCEATALDLNPVAYLALIGSLVYPQKFGKGLPETRLPEAETDTPKIDSGPSQPELPTFKDSSKASDTKSQLVEDVRYWAKWVLTQAEAQIGKCFPNDTDGAIPVAYLWAKTITCSHCGGEIPLIKRFWLQKDKNSEAVAYRLCVDKEAKSYTIEILHGNAAQDSKPDQGTMRGATVECIYCDTPTEREGIVEQAQAGGLGQHLMVVVLKRDGETGRDFRPASVADRTSYSHAQELLAKAERESFEFWGGDRLLSVLPDEPTPPSRARSVSIRLYGIKKWSHLYNHRQLLALITLGQQIRLVQELLKEHNIEYSQAIALYLDFILAKMVTYNSSVASWSVYLEEGG